MEKVKGVKIYAPRKESHPVDEVKSQLEKAQNQIIEMESQLKAIVGSQLMAKGVSAEIKAETVPDETENLKAQLEAAEAENKKLKKQAAMTKARAARGKKNNRIKITTA